MKTRLALAIAAGLLAGVGGTTLPVPAQAEAVDAAAAQRVFRAERCGRCHDPVKEKKGKPLATIAEEHKGDENAVRDMVEFMLSGKEVTMSDGEVDTHAVPKNADPQVLGNIARWILTH
jgi:cytochrome c